MSAVAVALDGWDGNPPDWVNVLAEACEASSQNKVAARLQRSPALVSNVLRNRYGAGLEAVEELVRGVLMAETIDCPMLGELPTNECQSWRKKAGSYSSVNALRVRMFRACQRCPRFKAGGAA